ncbi:uncharacterized protein LOC141691246 [Apium graveolens]|uniref:uncharacterized protein LOC141691246 n=1 Tax=Apium graveolens TaxID=4045 RepID=UPI003D7A2FA0
MENPKSVKDLQKLTGCVVALRRFIPQLSKRCLPFFSAMKKASKSSHFEWNDKYEKNFSELKALLTNPPIPTRPLLGEPLRIYLSASDETVAAVLVRVDEGNEIPVYYISHSLRDAEVRDPQVEKLVYPLVIASRKLRHYFQAREIHVLTNQPLKRILHKPDMTGRLAAWTIELSQFYIEYRPRTAIKAQVLLDFVAECQFQAKAQNPDESHLRPWLLFVDGSLTAESGGTRIILISPEGFKVQQALKFEFPATNNVAEYEALITGLKLAADLEAEIIDIFGDSQLVSKQKHSNVDREENQWVDSLAKLGSSNMPVNLNPVYVDILTAPAIDEFSVNQIQDSPDWRKPFLDYIIDNKLPDVKSEARSLMTTPRRATGETPFRLAYGIDVVLPVEISLISPRVEVFDPSLTLEGLRFHNDLLEETREKSRLRMITQQEKTAKYFNKKVKNKRFKVGDLVLRDSAASQPTVSGKFKPTWEGPYRVSKVVSAGTYELSHLDGQPFKNAWNDIHLKKFYQ